MTAVYKRQGVDPDDFLVHGRVQPSPGMELVPDDAPGPLGQHLEALVFQGRLVPVGMGVSPAGVEPAGHAGAQVALVAVIPHRNGEIQIAPGTPRQGFKGEICLLYTSRCV